MLLVENLGKLGWIEGRNVRIDYRTYNADPESLRAAAADLIALRPDVIFAPALSFVVTRAQTKQFRSCSCGSPIRSGAASSRALHDPAATSPDSQILNPRSLANGWDCSRRLRRSLPAP